MMKIKKYIYLIMAITAALITAIGVFTFLKSVEARIKRGNEFVEVVVARENIDANTLINSEMLAKKEIPLDYVHEYAARDTAQLIGGITKGDIFAGEQVLTGKIAVTGEAEEGFSFLITPGMRAVAVAINEVIGVGGLIVPGDRVDVVAVLESREEQEYFNYGKIIIQNVRVLAVGQKYDPLKLKEVADEANTITLEVQPAEVVPLALASEKGSIRLVLRSPVDEEKPSPGIWRMNDYLR